MTEKKSGNATVWCPRRKYEIVELVVKSGKSKIFNNWHEHTGVSEEDFLAGMKWLVEAEYPDNTFHDGRLRYRLGCTRNGEIVKIKAAISYDYVALYRMDNGELWANGPCISAADRV